MHTLPEIRAILDTVYRQESRRIFATLVRLVHDFDLAEEMLQESFTAAWERWPQDGVPDNPRAWLIATGRYQAINIIRRRGLFDRLQADVVARFTTLAEINDSRTAEPIEDDRLRLIFTCCHPAIEQNIQIPLTLREVCGLTTEEIASAFLTNPKTMAQRIVRGKAKIRDANIPYIIPEPTELPDRLESVLAVVYLVFNEGYSATMGDALTRADLSGEAIRLGRLIRERLPDPEAVGLLALMILQESRRRARTTLEGDIVLLEDQDRKLWDGDMIREGQELIRQVWDQGEVGVYSLQAAIAAVHAAAPTAADTDWQQITALYDILLLRNPSPVVELNRAVAVAMRDGPAAGLTLIESLLDRGTLSRYHLAHAAQADLLRRLGRRPEARIAYQRALECTQQEPERRYLQRRLANC